MEIECDVETRWTLLIVTCYQKIRLMSEFYHGKFFSSKSEVVESLGENVHT